MKPFFDSKGEEIVTEIKYELVQYPGTAIFWESSTDMSNQVTGSFTYTGNNFDRTEYPNQVPILITIPSKFLTEFLPSRTSTSKQPIPELLERALSEIFSCAENEEFEYGYISELSMSLEKFINIYGTNAIEAIQNCLPQKDVNTDILIETLYTLGKSQHEATYEKRLLLLLSALSIPSARIRCGASLALAYMDDPKAIPVLRKKLETEAHDLVKHWFQRTLEQLEETQIQLQQA